MRLIDLFNKLKLPVDDEELFPVKMVIQFKQGDFTYIVAVEDVELLYNDDKLNTIYFKGERKLFSEIFDKSSNVRILGGDY